MDFYRLYGIFPPKYGPKMQFGFFYCLEKYDLAFIQNQTNQTEIGCCNNIKGQRNIDSMKSKGKIIC